MVMVRSDWLVFLEQFGTGTFSTGTSSAQDSTIVCG